MEILSNIGYFILAIFPLVVIHELGHFLAAKLTGTRADVFAIGMGPRLFGWNRKTGFSFGNLPDTWDGEGCTDYRLSALPLGGYVRILGMVDESMEADFANKPVQPWEFRAKGTWQKIFMISAGVIMNILLAIAILVGLNFANGKTVLATRTISHVAKNSPAEQLGFRDGDKVLKMNGIEVSNFDDLEHYMFLDNIGKDVNLAIERGGQVIDLPIKAAAVTTVLESRKSFGLYPEGCRTFVAAVEASRPAAAAGFQAGDTVLEISSKQLYTTEQFQEFVQTNKGQNLNFVVQRKGGPVNLSCTPDESGRIGVSIQTVITGKMETTQYGFFEALSVGTMQMKSYAQAFVNMVLMIFKGEVKAKNALGGPLAIAKSATQSAQIGWSTFLVFVSTLSVTLAVLNILPIPALDGGHLVFIIIEGILRREVSVKVKMAFQQVGFIALLMLMAFVLYNDFTRH